MTIAACPPMTAPVMGVVVFVPADFKILFPEFVTVADASLQFNFLRATVQLNNSCCSRVCDANLRELLLNLLTAHITALTNGVNGQPPAGIVGRVASATEGSVSVDAEYASVTSAGLAYYAQTRYGAEYWQATSPYRTMVYVAADPDCCAPGWPNMGWGEGFGPVGNGNCGNNGGSC